MEKIKAYIKTGKGLGLLFLLAASVLMTLFMMFFLKQAYSELRPQIMLVADEMLPITVSGGKVVAPQDVYKRVDIKIGNGGEDAGVFPVVLDTKSNADELPKAKAGLFIMKNVMYLLNDEEVKRVPLRDGELTKSVMEEKLNALAGMLSLIISVVLILMLFGFSLLEAVIAAGFGCIFLKTVKADKLLSFDGLMRLSAVVVSFIEIIGFALSLAGAPLLVGYQFILMLVCVGLFLYREKMLLQ